MTNNFRALCADLIEAVLSDDSHIDCTEIARRARAALADGPAVPAPPADGEVAELVAWLQEEADDYECRMMTDFRALCAELADAYLRTLEHINNNTWLGYEPSDDPLLQRARASLADEPAAPAPPADGEVAELVEWLREQLHVCLQAPWTPGIKHFGRAAELLEHLSPPQPVPVSERPWEREGWCDTDGLCWLGSDALDGCTPTWLYGPPAWAERFPNVHRVLLPAHALPLPEVGD